MLVSIDGRMGQGKTAAATGLAVAEFKLRGVKIFSTYHLNDVIICPHCSLKHPIHKFQATNANLTPDTDSFISPEPEPVPLHLYQCTDRVLEVKEADEVEHIPYTYIDLEGFYGLFKAADQGEQVLNSCVFVLDEAYLFMDARHSGSKINRLFNSFVFQTRKRGVDMYITTHDVSRLDKRIRQGLDLRISCRFNAVSEVITLRLRDMHTGARRRIYLHGPTASFPYYDTNELVRPQGKIYSMSTEELA